MSAPGNLRKSAKIFLQRHNPLRLVYGTLARRPLRLRPGRFVISFTFDDFLSSAYRRGAPVLRDYGVRGTYYTALGLMNETGRMGKFFTEEDLHEVAAGGHELACHTFKHLDAWKVSPSELVSDLERNEAALREILPDVRFRNFAYPCGHVTFAVKSEMENRFRSQRGVYGGINSGTIDLNLIFANRLYSDTVHLNSVERLIGRHSRRGGWLVFYTHDVSDRPSPFGCTAKFLDRVLQFAARSQAQILPMDQALDAVTERGSP